MGKNFDMQKRKKGRIIQISQILEKKSSLIPSQRKRKNFDPRSGILKATAYTRIAISRS